MTCSVYKRSIVSPEKASTEAEIGAKTFTGLETTASFTFLALFNESNRQYGILQR